MYCILFILLLNVVIWRSRFSFLNVFRSYFAPSGHYMCDIRNCGYSIVRMSFNTYAEVFVTDSKAQQKP